MKKITLLLIIMFSVHLFSYELNTLIDAPTAGILQKGEAEITAKLYKNNGLIIGTKVGLFPRFMFGVNYGAEQVVGNLDPIWHDRVEFNARFRIIDETVKLPAIAVGYDSQGHGNYNEDAKRYDIKSKGIFGAASKNFLLLGNLGVHFGANYSLEDNDQDNELNFFAGLDKTLGDVVVFMLEFDPAWNDNDDWTNQTIKGLGRGYLNAAFAIHFTDYLSVNLSFYDLLENRLDTNGSDRTLTLFYNMTF